MKNKQFANTLVVAGSVAALAGTALFVAKSRQDSDRAWNAYSRARDLGMTDAALELRLATHVAASIEQ